MNKPLYFVLAIVLSTITMSSYADEDIALKNLQGGEERLSDYLGKGQWVLFNVWGPKCPPCQEEVGELNAFHDAHKDKDAIVVSMALDFPSFQYAKAEQVAAFVDEYFVGFTVLLGDVVLAQQITGERLVGTPSTYLYDPAGELVAVQPGMVTQEMIEKFIGNNTK